VLLWKERESVAQLVEHRPFKALVLGSSPSALTTSSLYFTHFPHFTIAEIGTAGASLGSLKLHRFGAHDKKMRFFLIAIACL
jgi:hypothetical protein